MVSRISIGRIIRVALASGLLFVIFLFARFSLDQARFQSFIKTQFIDWSDWPDEYADTLRRKDWDGVESFAYDRVFPKADPDPTARIPHLIHYIWFVNEYHDHLDVSDMPKNGSEGPDRCAYYNPGWQITVWNASTARSVIAEHYAWFLPTYDGYRYPIQRIDAFKYFVLYHFGGIYIDMDISCRRSLTPLAQFPAWFPEAQPFGINNDVFAAKAKHPLLGAMIWTLGARNRNLVLPYPTIYWSTGPQFTSDILRYWWNDHQKRQEQDKDSGWRVLSRDFYSEGYTFFGHLPGGSWHGQDVAVVIWLVEHPMIPVAVLTLSLASFLILLVRRRRRRRREAHGKRCKERADDEAEVELLARPRS